jgi:hypothetical protein
MKTRYGFVSNSSSSSFVAIMPDNEFEQLCATLSPLEEALARTLLLEGKEDFCSIKCVVYECMDGNHTFLDWVDEKEIVKDAKNIASARGIEYDEDDEYYLPDAEETIEQKMIELSKDGKAIIHTMDF